MVCSRGESLTYRINQMKLFNAIAAAAVIGASFIAANPVEAQRAPNGWAQGGCGNDVCTYIKYRRRNGNFVSVEVKSTFPKGHSSYLAEFSCNDWRTRYNFPHHKPGYQGWDSWEDVLPGTIWARTLQVACSA